MLKRLEDLSEDELREIEKVYASGTTIRDTGRRLKLPEKVVSRHLRSRGLTRGPRETCGQNRLHPWNISNNAIYLESMAKLREAEATSTTSG